MDAADKFLKQCVEDGKLSLAEYESVRLGRERQCDPPAEWKRWTMWPAEWAPPGKFDICTQDVEIYINYPAWTQQQVADHLGITRYQVQASLKRVRAAFPSLQNDPMPRGIPELDHMVSLDGSPVVHEIGEYDEGNLMNIREKF